MNKSEKTLLDYLSTNHYDAIVVEGYEGVGKGRLLNLLSEYFSVTPYRPDYNLWQKYDHRNIDRWKISGFFWDVFSHFNFHPDTPLLFDRGVISGAVYNHDQNIALDYKKILRSMKVHHILVTCTEEDYKKFNMIRGSEPYTELQWAKYLSYTEEYKSCLELSGADYSIYLNEFNDSVPTDRCICCGHYSYGWCRHPEKNFEVNPDDYRCSLSSDKEVQDINVAEMQCL